MNEFDLRNFLYNNPLLKATIRENEEEKDEASKKALDKKEDELDEKDMEHETLKDKIKHHEGAIKNIKKELEDLSDDLGEDKEDLKQEKKDVKETSFEDPNFDFDSFQRGFGDGSEESDPRSGLKPKKDVKESALRKAIQNEITSILKEAEEDVEVEDEENVDVDVEKDVNVDVEKEVDIDDESEESKIEVDSELAGEDADTAAILGLLTKAQAEAEGLGDEKLMDQIGNTITYYTRAHVVKSTETRAVAEDIEINEFLGFGPDIKKGDTLWVKGTEGQTRFKKINKGVYKVIGSTQSNFYDGEIYKPRVKKLYVGMNIGTFGTIEALGDGSGKSFEKLKI